MSADVLSIQDFIASVDTGAQIVDIDGKKISLQPVSILQCLRLVKRFPKLVDLFETKVDKSGKPLPAEMQPSPLSVLIDAGPDAVAAFVACAAGKEGDEALEKAYASAPDSAVLPLFFKAIQVTLGGGTLDDFFTKVLAALAEAGILELKDSSRASDEAA